ncbi:caldesmon-like [Watersipora subatra]|uniref:caldesmon-like n=1 Tax=Watersipora subatra TaxID=2589382 RepID=UPI00355C5020
MTSKTTQGQEGRDKAVADMFVMMDEKLTGELLPQNVQAAHEMIRMGGISLPQVKAAMQYTCLDPNVCEEWEFLDLLKEMDRRYYLVQDFRWEFSMLDVDATDTITEAQARWFMQSVHGEQFSWQRWESFTKSRPAPGTKVSFAEIEVDLCNIPCRTDVLLEVEEEKRKREEAERKKRLEQEKRKRMKEKLEQDKQKLLEEQKRIQEEKDRIAKENKQKDDLAKTKAAEAQRIKEAEAEALRREEEEKKQREEERERHRREKEENDRRKIEEEEKLEKLRQEAEEKRRKAEEEAKDIEATAEAAAKEEADAEHAAREAVELRKRAQDSKSKKELEEKEAEALRRQKEMKEKKIRANLKVAIKKRKRVPLKTGVDEFKKAKLEDYDGDVPVAEQLLKLASAKDRLNNAMDARQVKQLEEAMKFVKTNGFEQDMQPEMIEANNLLLRLRRLERIRAEILELKQSTVAEIRSYSAPPVIVQSVMVGTFLLLGHAEKETKEWKKVQALVGKTGKEGLKRRCLEYDPASLLTKMDIANRAKEKMAAFELDDVRDVSAGAATFYLWASNMIEEAEMMDAQKERDSKSRMDDVL